MGWFVEPLTILLSKTPLFRLGSDALIVGNSVSQNLSDGTRALVGFVGSCTMMVSIWIVGDYKSNHQSNLVSYFSLPDYSQCCTRPSARTSLLQDRKAPEQVRKTDAACHRQVEPARHGAALEHADREVAGLGGEGVLLYLLVCRV